MEGEYDKAIEYRAELHKAALEMARATLPDSLGNTTKERRDEQWRIRSSESVHIHSRGQKSTRPRSRAKWSWKVDAELRSDESLLYLDCVIGLLHGAGQYLEMEVHNNPPDGERRAQIASLQSRVRGYSDGDRRHAYLIQHDRFYRPTEKP